MFAIYVATYIIVHNALMQHCTHMTLFVDFIGLLKQLTCAIVEKLAGIATLAIVIILTVSISP